MIEARARFQRLRGESPVVVGHLDPVFGDRAGDGDAAILNVLLLLFQKQADHRFEAVMFRC